MLLLALATTPACRYESQTGSPKPASAAQAAEIDWFDGTVEEAFEIAKKERRPVFLYWGAVWCPPCHALRTKLFTQPEFVARLAAAIPVYLDGDTERAQIWGEKLGTYGYPTVIVLDPDGREITRIQGTLPPAEYGEAVTRAIEGSRPVTDIVASLEEGGPGAVSPAELSTVAFYSFEQDQTLKLDIARRRAMFERLRRETPGELEVERARFLTLELFALADESDDIPAATLTSEQREELTAGLNAVLSDRTLRNANLDLVLYGSRDVVKLLAPEPGAGRDALVASWIEAAKAIRDDQSLSTDDRVTSFLPRLRLATLDAEPASGGEAPPVPEELRREIREGVKWAGDQVSDEDEMQAVMNTMAGLLEDAGLAEEAGALLQEKMDRTTAPYYYMGWLAGIEAESGNKEKAVNLYREAWLSARGSGSGSTMSAFRWGSSYLRRALQYTPDKVEMISADTETIVGDLLAGPDAFAGGNWSRLQALATAMRKWSEENAEARAQVVESLTAQVAGACDRFPDDGPESGGGRCRTFMADVRH
jgi:thiol-disulfide isomerase/thioredoxin